MEKNITKRTKELMNTAMVAAVYAVLTLAIAPLSFGMVQVRFSEMLMLLAFFDKKYAPGLILGCFIANCFSPFGMRGTKLLSDLYTDLKLPHTEKAKQWVLCHGEEIVWAVGLRSSELYRLAGMPQRVICVELTIND